jgi:extracellular matrix regulatory protein A
VDTELIHVGFGNVLAVNRVIAIVAPSSAPTKRLIQKGKDENRTIDLTSGRRTKAVLIMDSGHVVLAAITPETITGRVSSSRTGPGGRGASGEGEGE